MCIEILFKECVVCKHTYVESSKLQTLTLICGKSPGKVILSNLKVKVILKTVQLTLENTAFIK